MVFTMDSIFKRAIFIAFIIAINIIFVYTAYFYLAEFNQQMIVNYLIIIQILVLATFFVFRNYTTARVTQPKRLKNPRLQENAFQVADLLLKEFEYIQSTATQAMNDRHTMVNFFLFITAGVVSIIGSSVLKLSGEEFTPFKESFLIAIAFFLNIIGWLYFMHLIRLRQAWWSSAEAMNQIKEFYITNGRVPDDIARTAFLWDSRTVPRAGKKSNVFYYSAMVISFVSSAVLLFVSWLLSQNDAASGISSFGYILVVYHFVFQTLTYSLFLDYRAIR